MNEIYLSIVVPLYNEESNVGPLCDAIMREILEIDLDYEILLVNDGSQDKTLAAAEAASLDSRINVIDLKKHYGQTAAMASGISMARGRWIVTIDGDLQNDPADIPMMIEKAKEGYDIVVGWRHRRKDHLWLRKIPSALANKLIGLITGVPIKDNGCTLKVFRSKLIKCIPFYSDMHRFLPVLLTMTGARIAEVKVRHNPRKSGKSKYGLSRVYKVLIDLIVVRCILSLASHPSHLFARFSAIPLTISLICVLLFLFGASASFNNAIIASLGLLFLSFSFFILALGMLCEITYARSGMALDGFASLTAVYSRPNTVTQ